MTGQPGPGHGRKLGHRGVDASGETTYKKVPPLSLADWDGIKRGLPVIPRAHLPSAGSTEGWACAVAMLLAQAPPCRTLSPGKVPRARQAVQPWELLDLGRALSSQFC